MHLNPAHILNSPPFPHTPCDWPVVQQRWRDSAILASQAGMAWAAIRHHTTSPQRGQTTRPNSFSGTPRLNQTKAWNNPMRIKCAQQIILTFLTSRWRWRDTLFDTQKKKKQRDGSLWNKEWQMQSNFECKWMFNMSSTVYCQPIKRQPVITGPKWSSLQSRRPATG